MLIEKYGLEVFTPPCEPGAERCAAIARLTADISEMLPYLNATLRGTVYHRSANALTWKKGGHNIVFHAYEIGTSNVEERDAAVKEIEGLVKLMDHTWERRVNLRPTMKRISARRQWPCTNCCRKRTVSNAANPLASPLLSNWRHRRKSLATAH